mgnify:FL=1
MDIQINIVKTTWVSSIWQQKKKEYPDSVIYIAGDSFDNDNVESIRLSNNLKFKTSKIEKTILGVFIMQVEKMIQDMYNIAINN